MERHIDHFRSLIKSRAMNDTVVFQIIDNVSSNMVINDYGVEVKEDLGNRSYNGSENIPAIVYQSRAFENEQLRAQTAVANRYYVEVPVDFTFNFSDIVIIKTRFYEIRKVSGVSDIDGTNELQVSEIMNNFDADYKTLAPTGNGFGSGFGNGFG